MPRDINCLGKGSSALSEALSADLALRIIDVRNRGGPYADWQDLQARVHGLGPKKIEKLKSEGFCIQPVSSTTSDVGDIFSRFNDLNIATVTSPPGVSPVKKSASSTSSSSTQDIAPTGSLRDPGVNRYKENTWVKRGNKDLYTLKTKKAIEKMGELEVDHVWEIQVIDHCNMKLRANGPVGYNTRASQKALKDTMNSVHNLNVTLHQINQSKKGPFVRFINKHQLDDYSSFSLEDALEESRAGSKLRENNVWNNIKKSIVHVYDDLGSSEVQGALGSDVRVHTERLLGEMNNMLAKMDI